MDAKGKAHEITDSLQAVATMTRDGRALVDRAIEKALREVYRQGYRVGFAAAGEAITKELLKL